MRVMGWEIEHLEGGVTVISNVSHEVDFAMLFLFCLPPLYVDIYWGIPWQEDYYHHNYRLNLAHTQAGGRVDQIIGAWADMRPWNLDTVGQGLVTRFF